MADVPGDANYGNVINSCAERGMGVMAIRVLAGGALAGNPPSPHTLKTPFFPLALYERDRARADQLREHFGTSRTLPTEAIRFALAHSYVHSAIIGFATPEQIDEAVTAVEPTEPPMDWDELLTQI
jgi:aryl-alcohol dehydrogenase-like predicted oxidoreductase